MRGILMPGGALSDGAGNFGVVAELVGISRFTSSILLGALM
jgi:hypothetical protein